MKLFTTIKIISFVFLFGFSLLFLNGCRGNEGNGETPQPTDGTTSGDPCYKKIIAHLQSHCDRIPDWLAKAETSMAVVTIQQDGAVIWHEGKWLNGTWEDGVWQGGVWHNGTWKKGHWWKGTWKNGTWEQGTWKDGLWKKGTWWSGIWEDGTWEQGTWRQGMWKGKHQGPGFDPANL